MLLQQVCPELTHEAVEYEESSGSDVEGPLCMILAIDTQTPQQQMEPLKQALLEVRFLMSSPTAHAISPNLLRCCSEQYDLAESALLQFSHPADVL